MADHSFSMDWSPPTPEPVHNPYQGDYVPGGWPVAPPTPPPQTAGVFAKRPAPDGGILPAAKRVCRGLFSLGFAATSLVSKYTISATCTVAAVPAYYVVRQVQQRQHEQRNQRPRRQRAPVPSLTESPWHRAVAGVSDAGLWEMQPSHEEPWSPRPVPVAAPPQMTPNEPLRTPLPSSQQYISETPSGILPFQQAVWKVGGTGGTMRHPRRRVTSRPRRRYQTALAVHPVPHLSPPSVEQETTPIQQRILEPTTPPAEFPQLQSPYPELPPLGPNLPTPTKQVAQEVVTTPGYESDSAASTATVKRSLRSNKRRIEEQGSRELTEADGHSTAKRLQRDGPSVESPKTPTPVIVVQGTSPTSTAEAQTTPVDTSLLSPPRVRNRKVSTPISRQKKTQNPKTPEAQITPNAAKTPGSDISSTCDFSPELSLLERQAKIASNTDKTPESDISSTCDVSPELTLLEKLSRALKSPSPVESDISSTWNGSPPDVSQDARTFAMILAGGGPSNSVAQTGTEVAAAEGSKGDQPVDAAPEAYPEHVDTEAFVQSPVPGAFPVEEEPQRNLPHENEAFPDVNQSPTPRTQDANTSEDPNGTQDVTPETVPEGTQDANSDESMNGTQAANTPTSPGRTQDAISPLHVAGTQAANIDPSLERTQDATPRQMNSTQAAIHDISPAQMDTSSVDASPETEHESPAQSTQDAAEATPIITPAEPKTPDRRITRSAAHTKVSTPVTGQNTSQTAATVDESGKSVKTPDKKLAKLTLEEQEQQEQEPFVPEVPTPKASPHSEEKHHRVTRGESKRLQAIEEAQKYGITPLSEEWEKKVQEALRHGHKTFKPSDLTRVVPLGSSHGTQNWLNDEVINGYLKLVVEHGLKNDRPTQSASHAALASFFYNNLETKGYQSVRRWAGRAKVGGKNLLDADNVFIPINKGAHWTLCVVSGRNRTVTHYNSLGGSGRQYIETIKGWLKLELGASYKEEEWTFNLAGQSPKQQNMDDCGVFTVTTARQIMLGLTPMSYGPEVIQIQRKRIVAELVNGALLKSGE
ncbi:hypothetical protein ABEF95_011541 [Exophiala dermatitidis]